VAVHRRWWLQDERARHLAGGLLGVVWALAFPTPGWAGLAWVVPGLLWLVTGGLTPAAVFRVGFVVGLIHHLVALRWLTQMPHSVGAVAGWGALSGYCAVYAGAWVWLADRLGRSMPGTGTVLARIAAQSWIQRGVFWWVLAAGWVALEMIRARFLSGFAWNFLGASQWRQLPLIQVAAVTGVYGVSFLVCWVSLSMVGAVVSLVSRPTDRWAWTAETRLPLLALLLIAGGGFWRVLAYRRERSVAPQSLRLALIQPSIPQTLQWDARADAASFARIRDLSAQALALRPDALIWPEGSFGLDRNTWSQMTNQTVAARVSWVFNTATETQTGAPQNSAVHLDLDGQWRGQYDKRRLVMFGEYVPLVRWLPWLRYLTPIGTSFAAGREPVPFFLPFGPGRTNAAEVAPIICFEDTFPHGVREHVRWNTDFILELTNDAWFGESSAQWQHAANGAFRAIENGRPLVRCANNGLTVWFDPVGVPRELFGARSGEATELARRVYGPGFQMITLPVGSWRRETYYHRRGDVFGWTCVAWTGWAWFRSRRGPGATAGIQSRSRAISA